MICSQVKPKRTTNSFGFRIFQYTFKTDLLREQGVSTDEKKNLLTEHLQTRLGQQLPHAVHSVTVFCNFEMVFPIYFCSYLWVRPVQEQGSAHDDTVVSGR